MRIRNFVKKLTFAGLLPMALALSEAQAEEVTLDSTAAIVNDDIILESALDSQTETLLNNYKAHGANVDALTARKQALQTLITKSLIMQLAQSNGFEMTDMQLDSTLEQTALRNNTSTDNILRTYGPNLSKAQAREKFKEDYIVNEVRRSSVRQMIQISDAEISTLAKAIRAHGGVEPMYHIAQVIIPISAEPTENEFLRVQSEAKSVLAKLRNGANVEEVAAKYATSDQSADLGYVPETAIPLPFVPAIVNARPGTVVGPFRSNVGMHIIKVIDVTTNAITPIKTYDASHILIKTSLIFSDEAACAKLQSILDDIKAGRTTFSIAAKNFSEDPGSAVNGGDLGYAPAQSYVPSFARTLESLKVGQISSPVKTMFGWHIIKLNDVRVDRDSDEAFKEKANEIIFEREYSEAVINWERNLRDMAYIHVIDPQLLKAGLKLDQDASTSKTQPFNTPDNADSQQVAKGSVFLN